MTNINSIINSEEIAKVCHAANAAYCLAIGDELQPLWEDAPQEQRKLTIAGVEAHIESWVEHDESLNAEESHNNWLERKLRNGWTYGEIRDNYKKIHPCLLPYDALPKSQQFKDHLFAGIIMALLEFPED